MIWTIKYTSKCIQEDQMGKQKIWRLLGGVLFHFVSLPWYLIFGQGNNILHPMASTVLDDSASPMQRGGFSSDAKYTADHPAWTDNPRTDIEGVMQQSYEIYDFSKG